MQSNHNQADKNHTDSSDAKVGDRVASVFSQEEIKDTVRGFALAWIRGEARINFPIATELFERSKKEGTKIDFATATQQEVSGKTQFITNIMICAGASPATAEQLQQANAELFREILCYRAGDRIQGKFWESTLEERICKIEQGLELTNNLVRELTELYRGKLQS